LYSSNLSCTSALDGGGWSTPRPGRFTPGKETLYPFYRRLGGPQCRSGLARKNSAPTRIDPRTAQSVASCYTDCDIPAQFWSKREIQVLVSRVELEVYYNARVFLFYVASFSSFVCWLVFFSFLPSYLSIVFLSSGFLRRMNAKGCRDDYSPYFAVICTLRGTETQT
jgi:hypothetical protein